jgi:UDP-glucose 4-epimerase
MTTVLVTGAGGYIGSNAAHLFALKGMKVIGIDSFATGHRGAMDRLQQMHSSSFIGYEGDICEHAILEKVFRTHPDIQVVVHFAASCIVKESMLTPEKYFRNNAMGTLTLLESMLACGVRHIVFSSTCAVYGHAQYFPIDEQHPTNPSNAYGESKLMSENMIKWFVSQHGFSSVVFRYFNVYGASDDGEFGYAKRPCTHLYDAAVQGALGLRRFSLTCPTDMDTPDGTPIRDYVHVVDLVEAHLQAISLVQVQDLRRKEPHEVINLGTGTGETVFQILHKVEAALKVALPRDSSEKRQGEDVKLVANNSKARRLLGWRPVRTFESTVDSQLAWYKAHPKGW